MIKPISLALAYSFISAVVCGVVAFALLEGHLNAQNLYSKEQLYLAMFLGIFIPSCLVTMCFRILNGGTNQRPISALVLVFLISCIGLLLSSLIGGGLGAALQWTMQKVPYLGSIINHIKFQIIGGIDLFILTVPLPSIAEIISFALFGSIFGPALAQMSKGTKFSQAWSIHFRYRLKLFWQCGIGALVLSVIWTGIRLGAHLARILPWQAEPSTNPIDRLAALDFQTTPLEHAYNIGMSALLIAYTLGLVVVLSQRSVQNL